MKREQAYVEARRKKILEIMKKNSEVKVETLAKELEVSFITIRRDLQYLEDKKLLMRTYGGAIAVETEQTKQEEILLYRTLIAKYAAQFVEDRDTLFINTSSNALMMTKYITKNNVTVITNNGKAITSEHGQGVSIILTGGELRYPKEAMVGDFAIRNLQTIFAKKAFIGCSGISATAGVTTEIASEVKVNELMIHNATNEVYVLADYTKIGKNSSFISAGIEGVTHLITDEKAPEDLLEELRAKGVQIHQVKKGAI
ncbi:MAG: DeoR/GlpR transcriptional regulator [Clostridiales bacterium]|nr:DeoR/GlpR transcriptional regulator [Clostridiales bacterium]